MSSTTTQRCMFCGNAEHVSVVDVWASGEFMLDTCCEGMRDSVSEFLADDPKAAAAWLASLDMPGFDCGLEAVCGDSLRRVVDDDGQLLLDWNLRVVSVSQRVAKAFVRAHHRHNKPPAGWRFGAGVRNGSQLVAVAMVGRPVARALDHKTIVEVNRLCVRDDIPTAYVWNACSLLYGWAAREAKKRGFARIITYTLESEAGTTLRAAGWTVDKVTDGGSWNCPSRPRTDTADTGRKTRWFRNLVPPTKRRADIADRPICKPAISAICQPLGQP